MKKEDILQNKSYIFAIRIVKMVFSSLISRSVDAVAVSFTMLCSPS